jgi:hypothetical protein
VSDVSIAPALPDHVQFAAMVGLAEHNTRTANLHALTMQGWLNLRRQPLIARPMSGTVVPLRARDSAASRLSPHQHAGLQTWDDVRMMRLRRLHATARADLPPRDQALNCHFRLSSR